MGLISSTANTLRSLLRSESGFAVPTVLVVIVVGLGLAGAAGLASINAQRGTVRDQDVKLGLATADAGVLRALFRQNNTNTTSALPCAVVGADGQLAPGAPAADGWCSEVTGSIGATSYRYRVSQPIQIGATGQRKQFEIKAVSIGTSDDVSRRVAVVARGISGEDIFGGSGAIGVDQITVEGSAEVGTTLDPTGAETNGDIVVQGSGQLCGDVSHGVGGALQVIPNGQACDDEPNEAALTLPPPKPPDDLATNNSNWRFFAPQVPGGDTRTGNCAGPNCANWDATTRTLTLSGNSTVTLGGSEAPYSFCRLVMSGSSSLIVGRNASSQIFFDSPEKCLDGQGNMITEQISMTGSSQITTTSQDPGALGLYLVGSDTVSTNVNLIGTAKVLNAFVLYAPRSDVTVGGNSTYTGGIAGKTLTVGGSAKLQSADSVGDHDVAVTLIYKRDRYVECTGSSATPPDAAC